MHLFCRSKIDCLSPGHSNCFLLHFQKEKGDFGEEEEIIEILQRMSQCEIAKNLGIPSHACPSRSKRYIPVLGEF